MIVVNESQRMPDALPICNATHLHTVLRRGSLRFGISCGDVRRLNPAASKDLAERVGFEAEALRNSL